MAPDNSAPENRLDGARVPDDGAKRTIGPLPIVALVLGILSSVFGLLAGIPAIVCGILSLRRIHYEPTRRGGRGLALAGLICGACFSVLWMILAVIVIDIGLQKARQQSRATVCMSRLRGLGNAMQIYLAEFDQHFPSNGVLFPIPGGSAASPTAGYGNGETNMQRWDLPYGKLWANMGMNRQSYVCPSDDLVRSNLGQLIRGDTGRISYVGGPPVNGGKGYWSYSVNTVLNSEGRFRERFQLPDGLPWMDPLNAYRLKNTSDFIYFVEEDAKSRFDDEVIDPPAYNGLSTTGSDALTNRHNGGGNVSFGDGHCEWFNASDFNAVPAGKPDHATAVKSEYTRLFFPDRGLFAVP
jgi:prepilin-type processing-associated H-X9-DG protein